MTPGTYLFLPVLENYSIVGLIKTFDVFLFISLYDIRDFFKKLWFVEVVTCSEIHIQN